MHHSLTLTVTLLAVLLTASLAQADSKAPGAMRIAPPAGHAATKPTVPFSHAGHAAAKIDCRTCHHTWDGTGKVRSCSSAGCHDQPGRQSVHARYHAFHAKRARHSCVGCHKASKARSGHALPKGCKDCHAK